MFAASGARARSENADLRRERNTHHGTAQQEATAARRAGVDNVGEGREGRARGAPGFVLDHPHHVRDQGPLVAGVAGRPPSRVLRGADLQKGLTASPVGPFVLPRATSVTAVAPEPGKVIPDSQCQSVHCVRDTTIAYPDAEHKPMCTHRTLRARACVQRVPQNEFFTWSTGTTFPATRNHASRVELPASVWPGT